MTLAYERLIGFRRELQQSYTVRDTILYALGAGAGIAADTPAKLSYVYEQVDGQPLQALPTMSCVLAAPGFWQREEQFGIDWRKVLHGEQSVTMHKPLPVEGEVHGELAIEAIYDKGEGKGALLYSVRELYDRKTGDLLATIRQSSFLRGNGGQGGLSEGAPKPHAVPTDRAADISVAMPTRPEQALIYRLSGDYNPLHADPAAAKASGFEGPILHGMASYGLVGRALLSALCDDDSARLKRLDVRFSTPVYPGETLVTEIWRDAPGKVSFLARVAERGVVAINNGYAEYE
jgi:acyl dehydratase